MTSRRTAPKLAERGEPGAQRWLSIELKLVADVGFIGKPNAGKSTLLAAASAAKPKIANYPFTTLIPNLGVCDLFDNNDDDYYYSLNNNNKINDNGKNGNNGNGGPYGDSGAHGGGLVLCDIPGLIKGAAQCAGMGGAFLRHVQRCRVLVHVIDGMSENPISDYQIINNELQQYDHLLSTKPQVIVINKIDIPQVQEKKDNVMQQLRTIAGHTRVVAISAATTENVRDLMIRLRKFVIAQPQVDLPILPQVDLTKAGLDYDSDDYEIISDPSYHGQWRIHGSYIEQIAKMTHWEYPEAVERFGRQLEALGISDELIRRGAIDGDLIMIDKYDFDFSPGMKNPYIPPDLLRLDQELMNNNNNNNNAERNRGGTHNNNKNNLSNDEEYDDSSSSSPTWRPFQQGGFLDIDTDELVGFGQDEDWDLLLLHDNDEDEDDNNNDNNEKELDGFDFLMDEIWVSDGSPEKDE